MTLKLLTFTVITIGLCLATGCDRANSQSKPDEADNSSGSAAPGSEAGKAMPGVKTNLAERSPHFDRVLSRLDVGGRTLEFQDHEGRRELLIEFVNMFASSFPEVLSGAGIDAAELIDSIGLTNVAASGRSVRRDGSSWLMRGYSYSPKGRSALASLLGDKSVEFRSPLLLPAATDLAIEARIETSSIPGLIRRIGAAVGQEEAAGKYLRESILQGVTSAALLKQIKLHVVAGLDVSYWDETRKPTDFFVQINGPKLLLGIVRRELEKTFGAAVAIGSREGWQIPLPAPFGQPKAKALFLFEESGRITVASRQAYLDFVESESMKLGAEMDFKKATDQFPKEGNLLVYASRQLPGALGRLIREAHYPSEAPAEILIKASEFLTPEPCSFCVSYEPDGIVTMGESSFPVDIDPAAALPFLSATSVMFTGARAWKKGSDRAGCITNIRSVQQAVRSYQNLNHLEIGEPIPWDKLISADEFLMGRPGCPAGGTYKFSSTVPEVGDLACRCSHEHDDHHVPQGYEDW